MNPTQLQMQMEDAISRFDVLTDAFTDEGSGWKIVGIENLKLCTAHYDAIGGSSFISTPGWVHSKKATLNIRNTDDYCFLYCTLAVSHYQHDNAHRVTPYKRHLSELNVDGLQFPMAVEQIPQFEMNNTEYAINVIYPNSEDKT